MSDGADDIVLKVKYTYNGTFYDQSVLYENENVIWVKHKNWDILSSLRRLTPTK